MNLRAVASKPRPALNFVLLFLKFTLNFQRFRGEGKGYFIGEICPFRLFPEPPFPWLGMA
jgi:hypothetical protein